MTARSSVIRRCLQDASRYSWALAKVIAVVFGFRFSVSLRSLFLTRIELPPSLNCSRFALQISPCYELSHTPIKVGTLVCSSCVWSNSLSLWKEVTKAGSSSTWSFDCQALPASLYAVLSQPRTPTSTTSANTRHSSTLFRGSSHQHRS